MCGILGIAFMKGHEMNSRHTTVRLIRELFKRTEHRGRTASGVAVVCPKNVEVLKGPMSASRLIETKEFENLMNTHLKVAGGVAETDRTTFVLGHCRLDTKGSPANNDNNHPIVVGKTIGIHNGIIMNDDLCYHSFRYCSNFPKRIAEVDSEIIFALMDYYQNIHKNTMLESIRLTHTELKGGFACAAVRTENPYIMSLFAKTNPISVFYLERAGIIVFASERRDCLNAIKAANLGESVEIGLESYQIMIINANSNEYSIHALTKTATYGGYNVA